MNSSIKYFAAISAFAFSAGAALAQTPPPSPAPGRPGILSRLFHPKPKPGIYQSNAASGHPMAGHPGMMGHSMIGGQIVGNKNSHVYHLPGDKGALPSPQNRVYFTSAAAAQAAGYHAAGSGRGAMTHGAMMHKSMTHGTMMHSGPMSH